MPKGKVRYSESKTFRQKDLRKMQDYQTQRSRYGHL